MHVLPGYVKVNLLYCHVLMQFNHVWTLIIVRPPEDSCQKQHHRRVQFGDVADILQEKRIDAVI